MLVKSGPGWKTNSRLAVDFLQDRVAGDVAGQQVGGELDALGVEPEGLRTRPLTSSVLPRPGRPSSRMWPRASTPVTTRSMSSSWPKSTWLRAVVRDRTCLPASVTSVSEACSMIGGECSVIGRGFPEEKRGVGGWVRGGLRAAQRPSRSGGASAGRRLPPGVRHCRGRGAGWTRSARYGKGPAGSLEELLEGLLLVGQEGVLPDPVAAFALVGRHLRRRGCRCRAPATSCSPSMRFSRSPGRVRLRSLDSRPSISPVSTRRAGGRARRGRFRGRD